MLIKIYDKTFTPLTILISNSQTDDFINLNYKNVIDGVGDASFTVRVDNKKISPTVLNHYNKIEIVEEDEAGTVRWVGVIVEKTVKLNVIDVKCYSLIHILDRRITDEGDEVSGNANTLVANLLTATNSAENTGISAGTIDLSTYAKITLNREKVLSAIQNIASFVNGHYIVKNDHKLYFRSDIGNDLTASVIFRFEKLTPKLANIISFSVSDIGREIVSKTYGKSNTLRSTQESTTIKNNYGLLEEYKNFADGQDQTTLDTATTNNNISDLFSPDVTLKSDIADNFEAGDKVKVKLNNGFITLDGNYQIVEKSVRMVGTQKNISIRLNYKTANFITDVKKLQKNIELLNTRV